MAVHRAPLWLKKPTVPGRAIWAANVALSPRRGLITPRQLGPISRIRPRRACSSTWRSSSAPSGPISLNPAEMMIAPLTPASTHSPITSGTVGAGVTTTARSTGSGTAAIAGIRPDPQHVGPLGIDRVDRPAERAADQVPEDRPPDAAGLLGRPDHRDRPRREDRIERQPLFGRVRIGQVLGHLGRFAHEVLPEDHEVRFVKRCRIGRESIQPDPSVGSSLHGALDNTRTWARFAGSASPVGAQNLRIDRSS